ncbi:S8 family peptidase [Allokutzneria sp. A3M-2-11 16]|uniref:S8 family peptidase n=1 Tax=Allokutzneria sp. A3M-2-11 16 TaxID=2962043 RepID=UPI0020B8121E|nr:S8 family peptidase [Allokutzneria sp. A3M-2-11 16]MCP3804619.1 S8 family peptidase [Allokutzneria sp. A3M-2-11 16]
MRREILAAALAAVVMTTGQQAIAAPAEGAIRNANQPDSVPGSYIVALKDGPGTSAAGVAAKVGAAVEREYTVALRGFSAKMDENAAKRLAADPAVDYVEQDGYAYTTEGTQKDPTWGLDRVDQPKLPLDKKYKHITEGTNVNAYIVDTGVHKAHSEFGGRASDGYDFVDNDAVAQDCNGHGTHVAGTVGGKTYGVAKNVKLVGVRVLDCRGGGPWSQVIAGIDWVAKNAKKPAVANFSLGGETNTSVDNAIRRLVKSGVTVGVSAGNLNGDACASSPARVPEALTVGSTDKTDRRSPFSNHGRCLDLFAPGSDITSASHKGGSLTASGTSMAAPHVVGAAALHLQNNREDTPAQVAQALTAVATEGVVQNAGTGSPNKLLCTEFVGGVG